MLPCTLGLGWGCLSLYTFTALMHRHLAAVPGSSIPLQHGNPIRLFLQEGLLEKCSPPARALLSFLWRERSCLWLLSSPHLALTQVASRDALHPAQPP